MATAASLPAEVAAVRGLRENWPKLGAEERRLASELLAGGQASVFAAWGPPGVADAEKAAFFTQVKKLDANYPGGVRQYASNARELLRAASRGENPLEGWSPSVPTTGFNLDVGSNEYLDYERLGLEEIGGCCFVVPAGGLGERLGFSGVKFALPAEITSDCCVLGVYAAYLRAFESLAAAHAKAGSAVLRLPLVIMASADTLEGIQALLAENGHFGLHPSQVHVLLQEKVAALADSEGRFAMESPYRIATKPHGHGDIHHLLHSNGLVEKWLAENRRWVLFFQDTNTLYLMTFLCSLGVSARHKLEVNSVAMPRRGKEAVGSIARLTHKDGRSIVVNVEYNQLEPLLLATGHPEGDVDGPDGYSPFPGNTNELVFSLPEYAAQLRRTRGQVPEFINPKYSDATRTKLKSPTRLECMMQDYPKSLGPEARVGFTRYPLEFGYFPCKNDIETAARLAASGTPPHGAACSEAAVYRANGALLAMCGARVGAPVERTFAGGPQMMWPAVVLWPDFAPCLTELRRKLRNARPGSIRIAQGASLEILGRDVEIEDLDLDGALQIRVVDGASLRVQGLTVRNRGHEFVALSAAEQRAGGAPEILQIRGYRLQRHETKVVTVDSRGSYELTDAGLRELSLKAPKQQPQQQRWRPSCLPCFS